MNYCCKAFNDSAVFKIERSTVLDIERTIISNQTPFDAQWKQSAFNIERSAVLGLMVVLSS